MDDVIGKVGDGLANAGLMAWEVWWALVLGFAISAVVQAWIPRERIQAALAGDGLAPVARATGLGAASSSCSYAAIAIARSLFAKGASAVSALAFQFASTNLVWELGLVLWILLGWQFTLAEFVGGFVMIALMAVLLRLFVSPRLEEQARKHAEAAEGGHDHGSAQAGRTWRERIASYDSWASVASNFRMDWGMLWKEITVGFLLAGFIGLLGDNFFNALFVTDAPPVIRTIENVVAGPLIAVLSFVCSIGDYMSRSSSTTRRSSTRSPSSSSPSCSGCGPAATPPTPDTGSTSPPTSTSLRPWATGSTAPTRTHGAPSCGLSSSASGSRSRPSGGRT
jgi:uncharacterized membrane protein YraQ (UPF0718 family)